MSDEMLKPSCDRKTKFWKGQKNTFGLLPGLEGTCPGATTAPGGCWHIKPGRKLPECYVASVMNIYKGVYAVLEHNTKLLKLADLAGKVALLNAEFARFRKAELRRKEPRLVYRLHWAGDIFDMEYARALALAINQNPDIEFWNYTRSLFAVPELCNIKNLKLYISTDPVNIQQAMMTFAEYKTNENTLQICYMSKENDFPEHMERTSKLITAENELRTKLGYTPKNSNVPLALKSCPVDTGQLGLENGCSVCKRCFKTLPDPIWFAT